MILNEGHSTEYLRKYSNGEIPMGLGLGCELDDYLVWKPGELNIILGHDNVGKTYFMEWYFLALATVHGLTFTLFMDENYHGKVMRDLIQMYMGKPFMALTVKEIRSGELKMEHHFKFVDNQRRYSHTELLDIFKTSNTDNYLIDPFNGLKTSLSYSGNYEVLNDLKHFTKEGKTIYVNCHPSTASGRRSAVYPPKHDWEGHVMPPLKSDIEGGKPFANKADNFLVIHRLIQSDSMWNLTMCEVVKVKDTDTGGRPTKLNEPILMDYNFGLGFKVGHKDVIKRAKPNRSVSSTLEGMEANFQGLTPSLSFDGSTDDTTPF
jgi:hypothetical protein